MFLGIFESRKPMMKQEMKEQGKTITKYQDLGKIEALDLPLAREIGRPSGPLCINLSSNPLDRAIPSHLEKPLGRYPG